jgi:hypothetical protein
MIGKHDQHAELTIKVILDDSDFFILNYAKSEYDHASKSYVTETRKYKVKSLEFIADLSNYDQQLRIKSIDVFKFRKNGEFYKTVHQIDEYYLWNAIQDQIPDSVIEKANQTFEDSKLELLTYLKKSKSIQKGVA